MRQNQRTLRFLHIDVFADKPLEGNPLAVFPDSQGLNVNEMQSIAREMNLSETAFVFRRSNRIEGAKGIKARIFTVQEELPFAGHPALGTAWVLRSNQDRIVLDLKVGVIPVQFSSKSGNVFGEMTQRDPEWGMKHRYDRVASALGIRESDLDHSAPIESVSTGNRFAIVPFRSLEQLQELRPDGARMENYLNTTDAKFFYLVCKQTEDSSAGLHSRMIFYGGEDPATGSAAGPAVAWMLRHEWVASEERIWIEQGREINRPSQIYAVAGGSSRIPHNIRVGGFCHAAIEGELTL